MPSNRHQLFLKRLRRFGPKDREIILKQELLKYHKEISAYEKMAAAGIYVTTEKYRQIVEIISILSGGETLDRLLGISKDVIYDLGRPDTTLQLKTGDKVWFKNERLGYTVTAANSRFAICIKKFTLQNGFKFLYTIIDWYEQVRGPDNLVFGGVYDYSKPAQAQRAVEELLDCEEAYRERVIDGKWREAKVSVSHRRRKDLDIRKILIT